MTENGYIVVRNAETNELCIMVLETLVVTDSHYKQLLEGKVAVNEFNIAFKRTTDQYNALRATPIALNLQPEIAVAPTTYDFSDHQVGETPVSHDFVITNSGTGVLTINNIVCSGEDFSVQSMPLFPLYIPEATGSVTIKVLFDPKSVGAKSGTLVVTSDDSDEGSVTITLDGNGTTV